MSQLVNCSGPGYRPRSQNRGPQSLEWGAPLYRSTPFCHDHRCPFRRPPGLENQWKYQQAAWPRFICSQVYNGLNDIPPRFGPLFQMRIPAGVLRPWKWSDPNGPGGPGNPWKCLTAPRPRTGSSPDDHTLNDTQPRCRL